MSKEKDDKQKKEPDFFLKVSGSLQEDVDKGIARVSSKDMKAMGLVSGDFVKLQGKNSFYIKILRLI